MFAFPNGASAEPARRSIEAQTRMLASLSGQALAASRRLAELNSQAGQRLIEESFDDMQEAMRLRSAADVQSFVGTQSQASIARLRGYWQNVQQITTDSWFASIREWQSLVVPGEDDATSAQAAKAAPVADVAQQPEVHEEKPAAKAHAGQHEVDVHPSPLVEKLIANVAADSGSTPAGS